MTIDAAEADWMNAHTDLALHGPAIAKKRAAARVKLARPTALPRMTDEAFVDLYRDQWRGHANREHPMVEALHDPTADVFTVAGNSLPRRTSNTVTTVAGETLTALHVAGPYAVTKALKGYRVFHRAAGLHVPAPRSQQGASHDDFRTLKAAREFMGALAEADILTDSPTPLDDDARPDAKRLLREFVQTYGEAPE